MTSTEPAAPPAFDPAARAALLALLTWRRDVRAFRPDPLPEGALRRLLDLACLAPSVGLSEPWRFVVVEDEARRAAIRDSFEACNAAALGAQEASRQALYARLKLSGLREAPAHVAAFVETDCGQGHGLGRRTMPATLHYSVAIAIHTLWLAARLDGIGLGWVSILDPATVASALDVPASWQFVGYLCLGYPREEDDAPALQRAGWDARRDPACRIFHR